MKYFIKNLFLFPVKLAWDIILTIFTVVLAINIYCWICATGFGAFILIALLLTDPLTFLCPFALLVFLKHPWPDFPQTDDDVEIKKTTQSRVAF